MRYTNTLLKMNHLRELGYQVIEMWGCEFRELSLLNSSVRDIIKQIHIEVPLEIRDSFFGGRTEMFRKYAKSNGQKIIKFADVCSLYPFICKYGVFPVGHPAISYGSRNMPKPEEFKNIVGFASILILPPKNLRLPLLGAKINNKLMFGLCNECMSTSYPDSCPHSDEQRMIKGTYASCEIVKALELGYKLVEICEVWRYASSKFDPNTGKGGIFATYIDKFLKLKQEASGYPSRVVTEEDKDAFIQEMKDRENVELDKDKVESNPGLRSLAKMCLNSLW